MEATTKISLGLGLLTGVGSVGGFKLIELAETFNSTVLEYSAQALTMGSALSATCCLAIAVIEQDFRPLAISFATGVASAGGLVAIGAPLKMEDTYYTTEISQEQDVAVASLQQTLQMGLAPKIG